MKTRYYVLMAVVLAFIGLYLHLPPIYPIIAGSLSVIVIETIEKKLKKNV